MSALIIGLEACLLIKRPNVYYVTIVLMNTRSTSEQINYVLVLFV